MNVKQLTQAFAKPPTSGNLLAKSSARLSKLEIAVAPDAAADEPFKANVAELAISFSGFAAELDRLSIKMEAMADKLEAFCESLCSSGLVMSNTNQPSRQFIRDLS
jgi:hypothetical protein